MLLGTLEMGLLLATSMSVVIGARATSFTLSDPKASPKPPTLAIDFQMHVVSKSSDGVEEYDWYHSATTGQEAKVWSKPSVLTSIYHYHNGTL